MRVLFVDDEPNVLEGLRRMLWPVRDKWDLEFAADGSKALRILAQAPCDVIVTNLRMPGMDGVELLEEVRRRYPQTVRMVLSGQAETEAMLRSVGPAHQYLSKPCDADTLLSSLRRAYSIRNLLLDERLRRVTSQVEALPSLPSHYRELMTKLASPDASLREVAEVISTDLGMSAKILQLVNSAFLGLRQRVSSPAHAVVLLGLDAVKALALSAHVFSQFDQTKLQDLSLEHLWDHSVTVGTLAKRVAAVQGVKPEDTDVALMGGLLHDIGKLVFASELQDEYRMVQRVSAERELPVCAAEGEMIGATHAQVGAYLLGLWGLPARIVDSVAFHHTPSESLQRGFTTLTAVHVADALVWQAMPDRRGCTWPLVDADYLAENGLTEQFAAWQEVCRQLMQQGGN